MKFTLNESAEGNAAGVPARRPRIRRKRRTGEREKTILFQALLGKTRRARRILRLSVCVARNPGADHLHVYSRRAGIRVCFFQLQRIYRNGIVGLKNFVTFFTLDRDMPYLFRNTFTFAIINVPLSMVLGYVIALLVNTSMKGVRVFRTIFYLPCVIPGVASALFMAGPLWP